MKLTLALFSLILCTKSVRADDGIPPEVLYKKYKPAVVKILGTDYGLDAGGLGTGFFVSADGELVTNYHVIREAVNAPTYSAKFVLADGTEIRDFKIAGCTDTRGLDLCLVKLNYKPKAWFAPHAHTPDVGERVYVIGHPKGLEWSLSDGLVSALRKNPKNVDEIQVSAPINPGNSGGPIFDKRGNLVGVATYILRESEGLNFGIDAQEVFKYQKNSRTFISSKDYRTTFRNMKTSMAQEFKKQLLVPIQEKLRKGESPLKAMKNPLELRLNYSGKTLLGYLPNSYANCHKHDIKDVLEIHCQDANTSDFTLSATKITPSFRLGSFNGKVLQKPYPLATARHLLETGRWEDAKKKLTANQQKYLFSVPDAAKCKRYNNNIFSEKTECTYIIYNDKVADGSSYVHLFQDADILFTAVSWTSETSMAGYYYEMNDIFTSSLKIVPARETATQPR